MSFCLRCLLASCVFLRWISLNEEKKWMNCSHLHLRFQADVTEGQCVLVLAALKVVTCICGSGGEASRLLLFTHGTESIDQFLIDRMTWYALSTNGWTEEGKKHTIRLSQREKRKPASAQGVHGTSSHPGLAALLSVEARKLCREQRFFSLKKSLKKKVNAPIISSAD